MVQLQAVLDSNSRIATELPSGLVAVFVGATSGIGEAALKAFAKHASQPIVYFVGRSQQAADRITAECKARNADGKYIFIKADTSLIRNVDAVCQEIQRQEKAVNLLFMSTGTLVSGIGGQHVLSPLAKQQCDSHHVYTSVLSCTVLLAQQLMLCS